VSSCFSLATVQLVSLEGAPYYFDYFLHIESYLIVSAIVSLGARFESTVDRRGTALSIFFLSAGDKKNQTCRGCRPSTRSQQPLRNLLFQRSTGSSRATFKMRAFGLMRGQFICKRDQNISLGWLAPHCADHLRTHPPRVRCSNRKAVILEGFRNRQLSLFAADSNTLRLGYSKSSSSNSRLARSYSGDQSGCRYHAIPVITALPSHGGMLD
jgi:hypothetical protein